MGQTTRTCEDTNGGTVTTGTWSGTPSYCQGTCKLLLFISISIQKQQVLDTSIALEIHTITYIQQFCALSCKILTMAPLNLLHNYLVWAPLLPTPVTQAMFWLERPPGLVRTHTEELQEHGVDQCLCVMVIEIINNDALIDMTSM